MVAFAANSVLCRLALRDGAIDAAGFTALRLGSGALLLWPLLLGGGSRRESAGEPAKLRSAWPSAVALFIYASTFSFAYLRLDAAVGALVLFGAVQLTMVGVGLVRGQRLSGRQWAGFGIATAGLLWLTLPGASAPDAWGVMWMAVAGTAWGAYSLRGAGVVSPLRSTAQNFALSLAPALALALFYAGSLHASGRGVTLALASGGLTSALGYIAWYAALPQLLPVEAALVQLSVPVLAAAGGAVFMREALTARLLLAATAILSGIALAVTTRRSAMSISNASPRYQAKPVAQSGLSAGRCRPGGSCR